MPPIAECKNCGHTAQYPDNWKPIVVNEVTVLTCSICQGFEIEFKPAEEIVKSDDSNISE